MRTAYRCISPPEKRRSGKTGARLKPSSEQIASSGSCRRTRQCVDRAPGAVDAAGEHRSSEKRAQETSFECHDLIPPESTAWRNMAEAGGRQGARMQQPKCFECLDSGASHAIRGTPLNEKRPASHAGRLPWTHPASGGERKANCATLSSPAVSSLIYNLTEIQLVNSAYALVHRFTASADGAGPIGTRAR